MRSTPLLVEATPLDEHRVHVRFEDGTAADLDLSYLLDHGGVFEPLRDQAFFHELRADPEAGTWEVSTSVTASDLARSSLRKNRLLSRNPSRADW